MHSHEMAMACAPASDVELKHAIVLGESLRRFGGAHAHSPFWILAARQRSLAIGEHRARIAAASLSVLPFDLPGQRQGLPFSTKTAGAAAAEDIARADAIDLLVWMDCGSLILSQPDEFALAPRYAMGYRPVDHTLIGSRWAEPADSFWQEIYRGCGVPAGRLFAMPTTVDEQLLRPYFNAGLVIVRPGRGLFAAWLEQFLKLQTEPAFAPHLTQDLYRVFFHQAVLAGTVLSILAPAELQLLPPKVSYPLHMHDMYPASGRLNVLDEAVTIRHEGLFDEPGWQGAAGITVGAELAEWIAERIAF